MSIEGAYPSAPIVAQELGLYESDVVEAASIHFIFNHFSRQKSYSPPLQRMQHAFDSSITHVNMRINLINGYEIAFFPEDQSYDRDAMVIAALCSPFLKKDSSVKDLDIDGLPARITDETIRRAYSIQEDAIAIKETADLDHKGLRSDNDRFSKEAYFLSYIHLLEKMHMVECLPTPTYDSLSDHLRYDLICAPRYVNKNTLFGRIMTNAIDQMEDKVVAQLKPFTRIYIILGKDGGPEPSPK